mgnify:CR=1 FL=1
MTQEHYYDMTVRWDSDRKGTASSRVLPTTIEVATPPEFPKGIEGIWSPEHFFVAAVNSCLMTTFLAIAENSRLEFSGFSCQAVGKLEMVEGKYMISEITLQPTVTIPKADDTERAERILHKAEAACLISNSIKSRIMFEPKIEVI